MTDPAEITMDWVFRALGEREEKRPMIRLEWVNKDSDVGGHGEWYPATSRAQLERQKKELQAKFPSDTHWIESSDDERVEEEWTALGKHLDSPEAE